MPHCTKCGAMVPEAVAYCPNCGQAQATAAAAATEAKAGGLQSNVAAALAYLWFTAILWLILEPYNKDPFIRFHSFQAIAFGLVAFVVSVVLGMIPFLGWVIGALWSILVLILWLLCIFKAFNRERFKVPVIGDFADKQARGA